MRAVLPLLTACAVLAACSSAQRPVSSAPPSVSYQVVGNNVAATNAQAQNYCAQYGHAAQYRGVEAVASGTAAVYTCDGPTLGAVGALPPGAAAGSTQPPGTVGPPTALAPVQCADALHQDRPGGTDYYGPPVAGCPRR